MTKKLDLHQEFVNILNNTPGKRSDLIDLIAEELCIERESAYRRLSGRVSFSVREIGILARKLQISLDDILQDNPLYKTVSVMMARPIPRLHSMDVLVQQMEVCLEKIARSGNGGHMELYSVFDSLPIEFFMPFPNLAKFMFFKWGYHYIGNEEFYTYKDWNVPERITELGHNMVEACKNYSKIVYIWDYPMIWNLANDISFFQNICVLSDEDVDMIKSDLRSLLDNLERVLRGNDNYSNVPVTLDVYFSTVNIGVNGLTHISPPNCYSLFKNYFFQSDVISNCDRAAKIRDWIESMKVLCTKISESSERERRLFFKLQHKMLN